MRNPAGYGISVHCQNPDSAPASYRLFYKPRRPSGSSLWRSQVGLRDHTTCERTITPAFGGAAGQADPTEEGESEYRLIQKRVDKQVF